MNLSDKEIEKTKPEADDVVKNNYLEELAEKYGIPYRKNDHTDNPDK